MGYIYCMPYLLYIVGDWRLFACSVRTFAFSTLLSASERPFSPWPHLLSSMTRWGLPYVYTQTLYLLFTRYVFPFCRKIRLCAGGLGSGKEESRRRRPREWQRLEDEETAWGRVFSWKRGDTIGINELISIDRLLSISLVLTRSSSSTKLCGFLVCFYPPCCLLLLEPPNPSPTRPIHSARPSHSLLLFFFFSISVKTRLHSWNDASFVVYYLLLSWLHQLGQRVEGCIVDSAAFTARRLLR